MSYNAQLISKGDEAIWVNGYVVDPCKLHTPDRTTDKVAVRDSYDDLLAIFSMRAEAIAYANSLPAGSGPVDDQN